MNYSTQTEFGADKQQAGMVQHDWEAGSQLGHQWQNVSAITNDEDESMQKKTARPDAELDCRLLVVIAALSAVCCNYSVACNKRFLTSNKQCSGICTTRAQITAGQAVIL